MDRAGNNEEIQTLTVVIDKGTDSTPPEAKIYFNQTTKEVVVESLDSSATITSTTTPNGNGWLIYYTLTDPSGNATELTFDKFIFSNSQNRVRLINTLYNDEPGSVDGMIKFTWRTEGSTYTQLDQESWNDEDDEFVASYDLQDDETTIFQLLNGVETNDTEDGKITVQFTTSSGDILVGY